MGQPHSRSATVAARLRSTSRTPPGFHGCGPATDPFKRALVPNGIPGTSVVWVDACDRHDQCYETLRANKSLCDKDIGRDVTKLCREAGLLFVCEGIAPTTADGAVAAGDCGAASRAAILEAP